MTSVERPGASGMRQPTAGVGSPIQLPRWQVSTVQTLQEHGMTRPAALAEMLRRYCDHMHANEPVHTWATRIPDLVSVPGR